MKVILLHDIPGLGKKYDVKEVKNGYARNLLVPGGKVKMATPEGLKDLEEKRARAHQEQAVYDEILDKNLVQLRDLKLTIEKKVNEKGHLFATVHAEEISKALRDKNRIDIPTNLIEMGAPIKEAGEHKILVRSSGGKVKEVEFILEVVAKDKK